MASIWEPRHIPSLWNSSNYLLSVQHRAHTAPFNAENDLQRLNLSWYPLDRWGQWGLEIWSNLFKINIWVTVTPLHPVPWASLGTGGTWELTHLFDLSALTFSSYTKCRIHTLVQFSNASPFPWLEHLAAGLCGLHWFCRSGLNELVQWTGQSLNTPHAQVWPLAPPLNKITSTLQLWFPHRWNGYIPTAQ